MSSAKYEEEALKKCFRSEASKKLHYKPPMILNFKSLFYELMPGYGEYTCAKQIFKNG